MYLSTKYCNLSTRYCKLLNICWYLPEVWDLQKMLLEKRNIRKILGWIMNWRKAYLEAFRLVLSIAVSELHVKGTGRLVYEYTKYLFRHTIIHLSQF